MSSLFLRGSHWLLCASQHHRISTITTLTSGFVCVCVALFAVAWVCKQLQIPFVALKGVTDLVDGEETTREEFEANLTAAARALEAKLAVVLTLLQQRPLSGWASKF